MRTPVRGLLALCCLALPTTGATASVSPPGPLLDRPAAPQELAVPRLSDAVEVSLISILPGDDVYSLFGHSALRIRDPGTGVDRSYNFGTFDFGDSPLAVADFLARFTYGDLEYQLSVQDADAVVDWYWREKGRASVEQVLSVSREEAQELFRRLEINALPRNRSYQYDFFFDNCATRLLDELEAVLGQRVSFAGAADPDRSFRELLDPYLPDDRWVDLGMDLGLGLPADRDATAREAAFLPELLMDYVAAGRVRSADGAREAGGARPLVARTAWLTGGPQQRWSPDPDPPWPTIVTALLAGAGVLLTWRDARDGRRSRPVADGVFFGILGVAGLAVAFLWFVSLHDVTKSNFNLAWALPTHVAVAYALLRRRASGRGWGAYFAATAFLAAALLAGFPFWPQGLPGALAPVLALIAVRAGWLALGRLRRAPGVPAT